MSEIVLTEAESTEIATMQNDLNEDVRNNPIEEATLLKIKFPADESDSQSNTTLWVQQNIMKMSEEFGVDFQGCETVAHELFMKIDGRSQTNRLPTPKLKVINELKGLDMGNIIMSNGTRSRGNIWTLKNNEAQYSFMEHEGDEL